MTTDTRLSMVRVMVAYEAASRGTALDDLGAVAVALRGLTQEELDLVEDMLAADAVAPGQLTTWGEG